MTWTEDQTHPQTCQICHDPHSIGTSSGIPTDATVRISDDTYLLLAGFIAEDVPELVAAEDRKTMGSMDVVAVLTKALQEQQKTISHLETRLAELEKKLDTNK